ncbi:winged helix DNA-binding domain-containing protein [Halogeometricum luteum]|uniref:Winged helix DNA-binding domain-containing protein n=1 Tax=Halogeometricum luteum TaxID=2950537 RepID=A0ABU2FZP4_9EURY|nr:winged helix DNA-binding domain-containing protein [Halogeometricum sp. S3BR5-2]MDS0294016.1 winged helix DNA-binding domain-containing protein [Halogeometricum sp. S3BR5-2]
MRTHTDAEAWRLRAAANGLDGDADSAAAVVKRVCGIQAQDPRSAALSIRPRARTLDAEAVESELHDEVIRTWSMRGTLHLIAAEDLPWLLSLFGPHFAERGPEPKRLEEAGLDKGGVETAVATLGRLLDDAGPMTRDEVAAELVDSGIDIDPSSQSPNFLIRRAALRGIIREVAPIDGAVAYDVLDVEIPPPGFDREAALVRLAERYLAAYGPATLDDFVAWTGLGKRDARLGWEEAESVTVTVGDAEMLTTVDGSAEPPGATGDLRLLPAYDTYLLGYAAANRPVPEAHRTDVWPGAGIIRPTIVRDGVVVGTWRLDRSRATSAVEVTSFDELDTDALDEEVADVGRFLDEELDRSLSH